MAGPSSYVFFFIYQGDFLLNFSSWFVEFVLLFLTGVYSLIRDQVFISSCLLAYFRLFLRFLTANSRDKWMGDERTGNLTGSSCLRGWGIGKEQN